MAITSKDPEVQEVLQRSPESTLDVTIVGAGLGGLGAAISILLAGHKVTVLEAAPQIGEVGAGIQVLPNAAKVLYSWGMKDRLEALATKPRRCNFIGWKGNHLGEMDYHGYAAATGGYSFLDFHRATLHRCLLDRAEELGAKLVTNAKVDRYDAAEDGSTTTIYLENGDVLQTDLLVGADGIASKLREQFLGRADPPELTGDLAYRLLLPTAEMLKDDDLRPLVEDPQVNYWVGPEKHAVNYVLKGGELFNMVLLVPDDIPLDQGNLLKGSVEEMRAHFKGWDPRISKILSLSKDESILKWRLMIRPGLDPSWSNETGNFTMLGDAVHATLPYLASGAGMALEDGGVLGICLGRIKDKSSASKREALKVYEACRRERTEKVVQRGTYNQWIYHLPDGQEQEERDARFEKYDVSDREWLAGKRPVLPRSGETGDDPFPWRYHGVGRWLLTYDMFEDVEEKWGKC
ncbi:FAD/NAD(P)-binding domain-containing protein [Sarocladium strictum]